MYRRPKELKHRRRKSRLHSAKSQGSGRTKMGVGYDDLSPEEYEIARWKCTCTRCQDGKRHKWKRQEKVDPFEGCSAHEFFEDIKWDIEHLECAEDWYDESTPYYDIDLDFCEEIGLCLPEDYDNMWNYQWPCGYIFGGEFVYTKIAEDFYDKFHKEVLRLIKSGKKPKFIKVA